MLDISKAGIRGEIHAFEGWEFKILLATLAEGIIVQPSGLEMALARLGDGERKT